MNKLLVCALMVLIMVSCRYTTQIPKSDFIVCINFDDNCSSVYENALPIMAQYGFRGSVFTNSGRVGQTNKLSWEQLDTLKNAYHWEVGGHTLNHELLANLSYQQAEFTIATDYQNLKSHGLEPVSFATTFGYCPADYYALIEKYYKNIRTCFNTSMQRPIDRTLIGSFGVTNDMSAQQILNRITQGMVEKENMVVLLFHEVSTENSGYLTNCDPQTFAEFMQLLNQRGIRVLPLNEAIDILSD